MWDTIEHLKSPNQYISKINKILSNHGVFVFTTGDIGSLVAKFRKHNWRMIHPPSHLHYFTKDSVYKILKQNNFKVVSMKYPAVYRTVDNIMYNLFVLRNNIPSIYKFAKWIGLTKLKINLFDIMLVIAKKNVDS